MEEASSIKATDTDSVERIVAEFEVFVRENFQVDDDDDFFSRDINLWEEGYVDSIGVAEVIAHLEETYAIDIPKDLLFDPLFTSVDGIAKRVAQLL